MLRIDRSQRTLTPLASKKLAEVGLLERSDLQRMILKSGDAFFAEMGESLKIIGEEVRPTNFVFDRIDLLGIDSDGVAVIIELKRASHKLQLLQALTYASMISKWSTENFIEEYARNKSRESAGSEIEDFLEQGDLQAINRSQRLILLAEEFDFEVLATAEWLYEQYDVDIRCYRLVLATNDADEFLACSRIYPPPELTAQAKRRGIRSSSSSGGGFANWNIALANVENSAVSEFFQTEAATGREKAPSKALIRFRIGEKVRYRISARRTFAYVRQIGRFNDDEKFWAGRLSEPREIRPVGGGKRLRFRLRTEQDFKNFKQAWNEELQRVHFINFPAENEDIDTDEQESEE